MSVMTVLRRGLVSAAIPVAAAVVVAGAGPLASAQAAVGSPAHAAAPGLHKTARILLGSAGNVFSDSFTEAPNGALFYSLGSTVYVVRGNSARRVALHAGKPVIALAANASDLFVQTGLTVTEYSRSNDVRLRHWTLTSPRTPITSAGLCAVGGTLWSWTDWATDSSGFQFAKVSRIVTSSSAVHTVATQAYPGDMAANSTGLYYEGQRGSRGYLGHSTPSGVVRTRRQPAVDAPLALSGGAVDTLSFSNHVFINSYSASTLARRSSRRVSASDRSIADTGAGLLVLTQPCASQTCSSSTVSKLSVSHGTTSGTLRVPGAGILLSGPSAAVIEVSRGSMFLVRMAS
jgi:hypothetical protein